MERESSSPPTEPEEPWRPSHDPRAVALTVVLPTFMVVLDTSVANVSLPYVAGTLSASTHEATWMLTSYLVANAIVLPSTHWMARLVGRKRLLIWSVLFFTLASAASGAAHSLAMLIAARVIQGASGGLLLPTSQAVLLESFPREERGEAMAAFGLGVVVAPVVGPTLGGWITDNYSWRWIFYINVPIGVLAVFLVQIFIEDPPYARKAPPGSVDALGFGLMAVGLGALQVILDRGQQDDWFSAVWIRWFTVLSAASLLAFLLWERRAREPVVDLRVFRDRNFSLGIFLVTTYGLILFGALVLLPLFLEELMGYTAFRSGLAVSPRGLGAAVSMTIAGRLVSRIDGRYLISTGFLLLAWAGFELGRINLEISVWTVVWPNATIGLALGFIFVPLTTLTVASLPNAEIGTATGLYNLMRNLGGSFGIASLTTLIARGTQAHQSVLAAYLTPSNPLFQYGLSRLQGFFALQGNAWIATQGAPVLLYRLLLQQSALLAFVDAFRFLGFLAVIGIPLPFLLSKGGIQQTGTAAME